MVDFGLRKLLADTVKPLAVRAEQKGLELMLRVRPEVPDSLIGDPLRVRQILMNLLGNAIKFTEYGEIVITVSPAPDATDPYDLHFEVADTGIGIPADKQGVIFESFAQADGSTTRKFGGTGLGLAIASKLTAMMNGRIWVDSTPGTGSRFQFTAKFGEGAELPEADVTETSLAGLRVLVVDDNATNRRILEEVLKHWHAVPTLVPGGFEALARIERAREDGVPFDMALLDVNMPEMDGFMLAERMRQSVAGIGPAILMLSSADHADALQRCRDLEISGYIVKPVTQTDLYAAIVSARSGVSKPEAPRPRESNVCPMPSRKLRVLLAEDNPVNQKLAIHLLTGAGHQVRLAQNGLEAVDLYRAESFDLICMDLQMPEMGGLEATAAIRGIEREHGTRIPIIALTAHAMQGDRERCLEADMDGYVSKPIRRDQFDAEINYVLGAAPLLAASQPSPAIADVPVSPGTSVAPAAPVALGAPEPLQRRFEDEPELLRQLAEIFLEDYPLRMDAISEALTRGDAEALVRAAHTLKGAVSVLCENGPTNIVRQLEERAKLGDVKGASALYRPLEFELARLRDELTPLLESPAVLEVR
jgi:CheY-like chemotaxis protein